MKRLFAAFFIPVFLVSTMLIAAPASADTSGWVKETIPGDDGNVIAPCDIVDLAVAADGVTMYAATGTTALYQSRNAGISWRLRFLPPGANSNHVAVAPDDPHFIVVLDDTNDRGFYSYNGGFIFSELTTMPAGIYNDVAISPQLSNGPVIKKEALTSRKLSAGPTGINGRLVATPRLLSDIRYIGIVGATTGDNDPFFSYYNLGAVSPGWVDAVSSASWSGWTGMPYDAIDELKALVFSPSFVFDKVAVLVSEEEGSGAGARFHAASFLARSWDETAGFTNYPVNLVSLGGSNVSDVDSASISLAPDYLGSDENQRLAFVGLAITDSNSEEQGGILRLNDFTLKTLKSPTAIHSVAYDGTALVAGASDTNIVWHSDDPLAVTPTVTAAKLHKRPGGTGAVIVAWAGANVVAGTSGNESAFAVSRNGGESFNDISLIDTALAVLEDVAVSADGGTIYLASDDGADLSLWRYDGVWERVLSLQGGTDYVVHIAPENPASVYVFEKSTANMLFSDNSGETQWYTRICSIIPVDVAVESAYVLYALDADGYVARSNDSGFTWGISKDTTLGSGATITSISENNIIAGSSDGYVAYSIDGNINWTKLSAPITAGEVHVTADGLATSNYIYAVSSVSNDYVYRWKIVPSTTDWTRISPALGADFTCYDIDLSHGALYALGYDAGTTVSTVFQTLKPYTGKVHRNELNTCAGVKFTNSPEAMDINDQAKSKIWAIDSYVNNNHNLYSYTLTEKPSTSWQVYR
jgi:hypothetical protein